MKKKVNGFNKAAVVFLFCITMYTLIFNCPSAFASRLTEGVKSYRLENGLRVILKEDHTAPVAAVQVWVKAGSVNETEKEAGITHLIEHMIFKGTERRSTGEIASTIESSGGNINAYTTFDRTVYFVEIASSEFDTALDVLLDAIQYSRFDPAELKKEKEVVLEEYKRSLDLPDRVFSKAMMDLCFKKHPYRRPVIGYESTILSFQRNDITGYMDKWYTPENITVIAVGDFSPDEALKKIKEYTGSFPARKGAKKSIPEEPLQNAVRSMIKTADVQQVFLDISAHIPAVTHDDIPAIDILDAILGMGRSSRLYDRLKMKNNLVRVVNTGAYSMMDHGLFSVECRMNEENIESVIRSIAEELKMITEEPVAESELIKAKRTAEAAYLSKMEDMEGQAETLGFFEVMSGSYDSADRYLEQLSSVTKSDVMEAAKKYLKPERFSIGLMLPEKSKRNISGRDMESLFTKSFNTGNRKGRKPDSVMEKPASLHILPNGIRVIIKENRHLPLVSVLGVFSGGTRLEDSDKTGISSFLARMLTRGTENMDIQELADSVESMAGRLEGFSGRNSFGLDLKFLSKDLDYFLDLMADVILNPSFPEEEIPKVRSDMLSDINRKKENPVSRLTDLFFSTLYREHPYGRPQSGYGDTVNSITRNDLVKFYGALALPDNFVLSIAGDISAGHVISRLSGLFGQMQGGSFEAPLIRPEPPLEGIRKAHMESPGNQVHIMLGFFGAAIKSEDDAPMTLIDSALSGQGGRLFMQLRDKQSLAYSVTSFRRPGLETGMFGTYIACAPEKFEEAKEGILKEIDRLKKEGLSEDELEDAKKYVLGSEAIGYQSNGTQALQMALDELYEMGYHHRDEKLKILKEVTVEDIRRAANKYFNSEAFVIATLGPITPDSYGTGHE